MLRVSQMSSQVLDAVVLIIFAFLNMHKLLPAGLCQQACDVPAAPAEQEAAASVLAEVGSLSACMQCAIYQSANVHQVCCQF